jgi:hypothetical protein
MATESKPHYLSTRGIWQDEANASGGANEDVVQATFKDHFDFLRKEDPTQDYEIISKPKNLDQCFLEYQYKKHPEAFEKELDPQEGQIWYDVATQRFKKWNGKIWTDAKEGMIPDHLIRNKTTGKAICLEDKKQNGAGNAHERACKYATPKVTQAIQEKLGVTTPPVCWVFYGELADKAKYQHEIAFCLPEELFVLISPKDNMKAILVEWFEVNIRGFLD